MGGTSKPSQPLSVLVTGATGNWGGALARVLLRRGHHVRGLARHTDSHAAQELRGLGAELVTGDFEDIPSLVQAARGMDAVFAMTTPAEGGPEGEIRQGVNVVNATEDAGVKHLIFSSVSDADRNSGIPHFESKFEVERYIQERSVPFTIVAPVFLMDMLTSSWYLPALRQGSFAIPMPADRTLQHIALADAASFEAMVVEQREGFLGMRVNIASDELTGSQVAETLADLTGRDIRFSEVPIEQVRETNEEAARMYDWFVQVGYSADISALRRNYPEVGWHTFEEWARSQDWSDLLA